MSSQALSIDLHNYDRGYYIGGDHIIGTVTDAGVPSPDIGVGLRCTLVLPKEEQKVVDVLAKATFKEVDNKYHFDLQVPVNEVVPSVTYGKYGVYWQVYAETDPTVKSASTTQALIIFPSKDTEEPTHNPVHTNGRLINVPTGPSGGLLGALGKKNHEEVLVEAVLKLPATGIAQNAPISGISFTLEPAIGDVVGLKGVKLWVYDDTSRNSELRDEDSPSHVANFVRKDFDQPIVLRKGVNDLTSSLGEAKLDKILPSSFEKNVIGISYHLEGAILLVPVADPDSQPIHLDLKGNVKILPPIS